MTVALLPLPPPLPNFRRELHLDDVAVILPGFQNYIDAEWRVLYSAAMNAQLRTELPFFDFTSLHPGTRRFRHFCRVIGNIDSASAEYLYAVRDADKVMEDYRGAMLEAAAGRRLSFMQEAFDRTRLVGNVARAYGKLQALYSDARLDL